MVIWLPTSREGWVSQTVYELCTHEVRSTGMWDFLTCRQKLCGKWCLGHSPRRHHCSWGHKTGWSAFVAFLHLQGRYGSPNILINFFLFLSPWESFISRDLAFVINGSAFGFLLLLFSVLFCLVPRVRNHRRIVPQITWKCRAQEGSKCTERDTPKNLINDDKTVGR